MKLARKYWIVLLLVVVAVAWWVMRRRAAAAAASPVAGAPFGGGGPRELPPAGLAGIPGREGKLESKPIRGPMGAILGHFTAPSAPPPKPRYTVAL